MPEQRVERRLTTILCADVVGYTRLTGADEEGTIARLRVLRRELIDPVIEAHRGRVVKRTGDGILIEFASVVDAVRCAIEVQKGMAPRNASLKPEERIEFRIGINVGDVVVEGDDLLGDAVNIAARLEGIAEPGSICLSEDAWRQVKDKVPADYLDRGEQTLKNVARPVRVYAATDRANLAGAAARAAGERPRLSIVVLPFANIGADAEQEYFVDGVTESLTTDLSRIAGSFVIARNAAFTYKGKPYDVTRIGRELNVRYVLEGSVQRGSSRLRVNVQLIDAETGAHLWAERFDKLVGDLFDMQDEIVAWLANALNAQLVAAEARRAEKSPHPDSMDLYFEGTACWHRGLSPTNVSQARAFFERALTIDTGNIEAMVGIAFADAMLGGAFMAEDRASRLAAAEAALSAVFPLTPDHAFAHFVLAVIQTVSQRETQAIAHAERALTIDRNLASAHAIIGLAKIFIGRAEETETHVRDALRLSPRDTTAYLWMHWAGLAKLGLGAYEEAADWYSRSVKANPSYPTSHFNYAAALAHLGRLSEARGEVAAGLTLNTGFNIARYRAGTPSENPTYVAQRERLFEGMRKAGVPEA